MFAFETRFAFGHFLDFSMIYMSMTNVQLDQYLSRHANSSPYEYVGPGE